MVIIPYDTLPLQSHSHQNLPCASDVVMDLTLNFRIDHVFRATTVWAGHFGCRAKQPADQRALLVNRAAIRPQVYAAIVI